MTYARTAAFFRPRLVYAVCAGVLVWSTWLISLALGRGETDLYGQIVGTDHLAFYTAARLIREGRGADVYNYDIVGPYQSALFPPGVWQDTFEAFRNPPFYALPYTLTAGLPYALSSWFWIIVSLAALVVGVRLLRPEQPWRTVGWAMTFLPVFCVLSYGQNTLLSFAIFAAVFRLLAADRRFLAGFVAGLLWFKPTLLIGLFFWSLLDIRRLWPCWLGVIAGGVVLSAGSWPLIPEVWTAFFENLRVNLTFDNFEQWKMHNPKAFWKLLRPEPLPLVGGVTLQEVLIGLSTLAGIVVFVQLWRRQRNNLPVMFAAAVFLTLWVSPHTLIYEWALAILPAILLWTHAPRHRDAWVVLFALTWAALFVSTDFCQAQLWAERRWLGTESVLLQVSVPVLGWVGWQAACVLIPPEGVVESPDSIGRFSPTETHGSGAGP
ncbi:MAG: DUF2029 domain-containing protein [Bacteroidales bacterium]|nr:DUF2029 domain-containing protein [Bacteroidales bacterium]